MRKLGQGLEPPLLLERARWVDDPRLNAYFATANDLRATLGRCKDLRKFFARPEHSELVEAYAVIVMQVQERKVLAPGFENGILRQDIPQVSVSFSEQRLLAPAASEQEVRLDIGKRIVRLLAQVALTRIVALSDRSVELQEQKAYLGARLRILELARDGMQGIVDDPATIEAKIREAEHELKSTVDQYIETKSSLATLNDYIAQMTQVFGEPEQHLGLVREEIRLTRMGMKVAENSTEPANTIALTKLSVGPQTRVIALVRCPRAELPPEEDLVAKAERYL